MAIVSVLTCTRCDNLILPGDRIGLITSGTFGGVNAETGESYLTQASEGTQELCADCTASVVEAIGIAMRELALAATADLGSDDPDDGEEEVEYDPATTAGSDGDGPCSGEGVCCLTCDQPDRCCAGFYKENRNFRGFGVTQSQYLSAVRNLELFSHVDSASRGDEQHNADACYVADEIRAELAHLGYIA